jgi:hypothetical protein
VMSYVLRHTPSGKRHASCGGFARAYGLEADWRPGRKRRPTERERPRRQRQTRRDYSPHKMTAPRRRVTTSSPKLLVQQPGPCRALPPLLPGPRPKPTSMGATTGRCPAQLIVLKKKGALFTLFGCAQEPLSSRRPLRSCTELPVLGQLEHGVRLRRPHSCCLQHWAGAVVGVGMDIGA